MSETGRFGPGVRVGGSRQVYHYGSWQVIFLLCYSHSRPPIRGWEDGNQWNPSGTKISPSSTKAFCTNASVLLRMIVVCITQMF